MSGRSGTSLLGCLSLWLVFVAASFADQDDLIWSTFLGGIGADRGYDIAVDESGDVYVTGQTFSPDFPATKGVFDTTYHGDGDVFLIKLNFSGKDFIYATFLGGDGQDCAYDMAVDSSGSAYLTGSTASAKFPITPHALDTTYNGEEDVFIAKIDPAGNELSYATYLGGSGLDVGMGIDIDGYGNAYIIGHTRSVNFPTTPQAFAMSSAGIVDAFVAKVNVTGSQLAFATYLGGSHQDFATDIALDEKDYIYVTGITWSADFPVTPGAFDTTHNGQEDVFVAAIAAPGNKLSYATFLGGSGFEKGMGIAVDQEDCAYVTGYTSSTDFPTTPGAWDTTHCGGWDVFVVKVDSRGSALSYATYLGGSNYEKGFAIALDGSGQAHVTGYTWSDDFPITPDAFDVTHNGAEDIYLAMLNAKGTALLYGTYLGGNAYDESQAVCVDQFGDIYVTGVTHSFDFPTSAEAIKTKKDVRSADAIVVKLRPRNLLRTPR